MVSAVVFLTTLVSNEVKCSLEVNMNIFIQREMAAIFLCPPRRGILLCTCRSVGMSVSLNLMQLITQEGFAPEASNLVGR